MDDEDKTWAQQQIADERRRSRQEAVNVATSIGALLLTVAIVWFSWMLIDVLLE